MNDGQCLFIFPFAELARFCRRYQVRELALFGSMLRQDHRPDSDVDLLVSFQPAARVTFLTLARMQRELEALLGRQGRFSSQGRPEAGSSVSIFWPPHECCMRREHLYLQDILEACAMIQTFLDGMDAVSVPGQRTA